MSEIGVKWELDGILSEIFDLYQNNLVKCRAPNYIKDDESLLGVYEIHPARMRLTSIGKRVYDLMQLQNIPNEDIEHIAKSLK